MRYASFDLDRVPKVTQEVFSMRLNLVPTQLNFIMNCECVSSVLKQPCHVVLENEIVL